MTRESPYRIHRELAETRQRPHAPPQPPRRGIRVESVVIWSIRIASLIAGFMLGEYLWGPI